MNNNQIQIPRLHIYISDFKQSRNFAIYILDKRLHEKKSAQSKLVLQAFNTSLIISYARPFGLNRNFEGQKSSSLKNHLNEVLDVDEVKLHDQVITMRDTAYAHSDARAHLFENYDYSKMITIVRITESLDRSATGKLEAMIVKWLKHLEAEKSRLKESIQHK